MNTQLIDTLNAVGKPTETFESPDGSRALLLPYGGRILGLFAPDSDENFYWTHTALQSKETAADFYDSDEWHNSGGDRTWLAPEVDIFFPNFPITDPYFQPRQLDPGNYEIERGAGGALRMVNRLRLMLSRSKREVAVRIAKEVGPAANPLRHEAIAARTPGTEYAGYTLRTSLYWEDDNETDEMPVGLWNLVQMPHGGDLLMPTHVRAVPKIYFGRIEEEDLIVDDHLVRYRMRAEGEHKLGVRAVAVTGRVGYLYRAGDDRWSLIVRNFFVNPSGEYVDVPWGDTEDMGYSTQACNVNSQLGSFSELEYHVPAIGGASGQNSCEDAAAVWAFRGPLDEIRLIGKSLLTTNC
ncbi:MAG: hypothetical protein JXM70_22120 [Pirellulales bacterium]|nr:hypothetical protein [Pirellulales bacterium]